MPLCNNESKRKISDLETFELINIWTTYRQMTGWVWREVGSWDAECDINMDSCKLVRIHDAVLSWKQIILSSSIKSSSSIYKFVLSAICLSLSSKHRSWLTFIFFIDEKICSTWSWRKNWKKLWRPTRVSSRMPYMRHELSLEFATTKRLISLEHFIFPCSMATEVDKVGRQMK